MTTATKTKWYYKAQKAFKNWKKENEVVSECQNQDLGHVTLVEDHVVYPKSGGCGTNAKLVANNIEKTATLFIDRKEINLYAKD